MQKTRRAVAAGQHVGDHRRRRRLAVGAGHGDVAAVVHQRRQQQAARDHRYLELGRRLQFGVVGADRRGEHHQFRVARQVLAGVAGADERAELAQVVGQAVGRGI